MNKDQRNIKKTELLAPAGNPEKMKAAFHYGADAVYLGGKLFNLRAGSGNFSDEELQAAVPYAHGSGKKIYVTLNVIPHNEELRQLPSYVRFLEKTGVDGVIVADLGVFQIVREESALPVSVSTQASCTNWRAVDMWKRLGAKRAVLAREITLEEIREIRERVPGIELEVFVHGAMCMSVSGRCLLSNYLTGRDANRGDCAQACRWKYAVVEEKRPGQYMPVLEDERGSYIFSSKDLCTVEFLDRIIEAGADSLKIEGRMKGVWYVANSVKVYREALDSYEAGNYSPDPRWTQVLESISNRLYTPGFYLGNPGGEAQNIKETRSYFQSRQLAAVVTEKRPGNLYVLSVRNRIRTGETLEAVRPRKPVKDLRLPAMTLLTKEAEEPVEHANPNSSVLVKIDTELEVMDMLGRKMDVT